MHLPLLTDIVVLLGVALGVLYVSHHARLPAIVGYLVTGMLLGPHGLGLVRAVHEVEQLAEFGVILVLFTIGLEFSLRELVQMRRLVLVGGSVQVLAVSGLSTVGLAVLGLPLRQAFFLGLTASLSSTAVVLRILQQRAEVDAPHGRTSVAILVYQDLMVVPMMLLVPVLAGTSAGLAEALGTFALRAVAILVLVVLMARVVVPRLLAGIVGTRSRDMFLVAVVTLCLVVAWAASESGLSLALGAFLAGLIVSESEYSHQALSEVLPFRDLFASFFFISIGMLLDVGLVGRAPVTLGVLVVAVLLVKSVLAGAATLAVGFSVRTAVLAGLALGQVGEFSFILAGSGLSEGIISPVQYQWFLAAAVASIGLTPFLVAGAPRLADALDRLPLPRRLKVGGFRHPMTPSGDTEVGDHAIVVGFGVNGGNVARAASLASIPFVAVEMNPTVVRAERERGLPILFGDASQRAVLEHAGIQRARVVVVAISDAAATRRVTALARSLNPGCRIIARTRYTREVDVLKAAGADVVIPEELETSLEIVARVLTSYLVPRRDIEAFLAEVRAGEYEMLRPRPGTAPGLADLGLQLSEMEVSTLRVDAGSALDGRRLSETDLRPVYGITVVAIRREEGLVPNPGAETLIRAGDALVLLGLGEEISGAAVLFRNLDALRGS